MIHYSCDRCRQPIETETDLRYQVTIVTQVMLDEPENSAEDSTEGERDHLNEIDELLLRVDDDDCEQLCQDLYQSRRFDLCSSCYQQYKKNPLGMETTVQVGFSEN